MERLVSDNEIQARLAADDPSAVEMLWDTYAADLLGYLVCMLRSQADAEDVLQEVFVGIVNKRHAVASARHLKPYLFRMARNAALNGIKHNARAQKHFQESAWLVLDEAADVTLDGREGQLPVALEALPEEQRTVIVLKHYREQTFSEIGESLGISEHTAGSRYRYGMQKLRKRGIHLTQVPPTGSVRRHEDPTTAGCGSGLSAYVPTVS